MSTVEAPRGLEWYRSRSLWLDEALQGVNVRPSVNGDLHADVVIVGGGLIGVWAAYSIARAAPERRIALLERNIVGFGAAGRNGGWAGAGISGDARRFARRVGWDRVREAAAIFRETVDDIGTVIRDEGFSCDYLKGGTLTVATSSPQVERLQSSVAGATALGLTGDGDRMLSVDEADALVRIAGTRAAAFTPDCARIHPAHFVRGLAVAAERRGVQIFEHSEVIDLRPDGVVTASGNVRAPAVIMATEAWAPTLPGGILTSLPLTSMMIATEPLPASVWDQLGWPHGLTVRDKSHLFFYAQRTADDRIAIGGRGSPYRLDRPYVEFGDHDVPVWQRLERTIATHFPAAAGARITHRWGGMLAVPRDWCMSIRRDSAGRIRAGGLAGHGVVAAAIAGRTIADLVLDQVTRLTAMPWVEHRSPRWEPEPLRAAAATAIVRLLASADAVENRTDRTASRARLVAPFMPPS